MIFPGRLFCSRLVALNSSRRLIFTSRPCSEGFRYGEEPTKIEIRLRKEDKVPDTYRLVYRGPMETFIGLNQAFASLSALNVVALFTYYNAQAYRLGLSFIQVAGLEDATTTEIYSVGILTSLCIVSILSLSLRYPLRIYKDEESNKFV
jgi:hypothetical protein